VALAVTDTPIAEQLAADLGMPWPLRRSWHVEGHLYEREGDSMGKPTPEEIEQMRAGAAGLAEQGVDTSGIEAVIDLVTEVDPGPQ
jgi:hypothetical protein